MIIHLTHHAYSAKHDTTTPLIEMSDTWFDAYEDGKSSIVCLLDMLASFDIVDHSLLLRKL